MCDRKDANFALKTSFENLKVSMSLVSRNCRVYELYQRRNIVSTCILNIPDYMYSFPFSECNV